MLREVWPFVDAHRRAGRPVALARLVARDGPGARPLGSTMAVAADGTWRGSVSGGCVEAVVVEAARAVLAGAAAHVLPVTPGEFLLPWEEAPACSATMQVLVLPAPPPPVHDAITVALRWDRPVAVGVGLQPPYRWSVAPTRAQLPDSHSTYVEELPRRRRLVLVGATDLAGVVATLAESLDLAVSVVDPRPLHVGSGALPASVRLVRAWPGEWLTRHPPGPGDAVVTVSHDPRIDDQAIRAALAGGAGHVAALGSRATHTQRLRRLAGTPGLDRLAGPAGLDLGGTSLAEAALSILAEVVAAGNGRAGGRLRDSRLPIGVHPMTTAHG
ncbi:XdhC family protein [Micromonospora sp. HUAS LYJ1]|uniref:XdhC family protein n=1 Tax=Micromonospora sp. HUAS LYJ1 TaxID=3061626 RepID=UPI002673FBF7|nr:XdhC/CoxI family protein [Micromonospora sp. HUAS LYJ1]WKU05445.1 XdhC family protein [Micromonospora sp. HUAS LYJ1]